MAKIRRRIFYVFYGVCIWTIHHFFVLNSALSDYKPVPKVNRENTTQYYNNTTTMKFQVNNTAIIERLKRIPDVLSIRVVKNVQK